MSRRWRLHPRLPVAVTFVTGFWGVSHYGPESAHSLDKPPCHVQPGSPSRTLVGSGPSACKIEAVDERAWKTPHGKGLKMGVKNKNSVKKELALIRRVLRENRHSGKSKDRHIDGELRLLEPLAPGNRAKAAELLLQDCRPDLATKVIERGQKYGQSHPLLDYYLARAMWGTGRASFALEYAKKSARKWGLSFNMELVGMFYLLNGKQAIGNRWITRAIEAAERELEDESLLAIYPFRKKAT